MDVRFGQVSGFKKISGFMCFADRRRKDGSGSNSVSGEGEGRSTDCKQAPCAAKNLFK